MKKYSKGELPTQEDATTKKGRQPSPATFRCLMGLKDGDILSLQKEVNDGHILFLRNRWDKEDMIDMETKAKQIKQDRVLHEELVSLFNASIPTSNGGMKNWEDLVAEYEITNEVYTKILGVCIDWVSKKLTRGADAGPLPSGAKDVVNFLIGKKQDPLHSSTSLPWQVYVVGCNLEAFDLIHNVYKDPITIGVVVLDAAHGVGGMNWDSIKFGKVVFTLLKMTCEPKQFILLSFLNRRQMAIMEDALENLPCKYHMQVGSVDFLPIEKSFAFGAMESFVALTLVTMEKSFINLDCYVGNANKPCLLDNEAIEKEGDDGELDKEQNMAILRKKKKVIKATIKAFNDAHEVVCDIFSCGLASKVALGHHMKTIAVVCNSQEQREIEAACWRVHESAKPKESAQEVLPNGAKALDLPLEGVEESSQDIASLIMKERLNAPAGV